MMSFESISAMTVSERRCWTKLTQNFQTRRTRSMADQPLRMREPQEEKSETKQEKKKKIRIYVTRMGGNVKAQEVQQGTTFGDVVKAYGLERLENRLNGESKQLGTVLQENDLVVSVPEAIRGGKN